MVGSLLDAAKERFAKGELSKEQYAEVKKELLAHPIKLLILLLYVIITAYEAVVTRLTGSYKFYKRFKRLCFNAY